MDWTTKILLNICLGTVITLAGASQATAAAATYKWVDKSGNVHYSQRPPAQGNYETLNIHTQEPSGQSSGTQSTPSYSTPATSPNTSSDNNSSDVIKNEEAKGEALRKKKCEEAKKNLETYTVYRRVRDKNGNVIRLDDNVRAKGIKDSKAAIKEFCQ